VSIVVRERSVAFIPLGITLGIIPPDVD